MIYFSLAGKNVNEIKNNSLLLMSKERGTKNGTVFHNNRYTTVISFKNQVFKEYFKYDPKTYTYKQIKKYDANNLPFKYEVVDHNY
jgi:hypothetical protein